MSEDVRYMRRVANVSDELMTDLMHEFGETRGQVLERLGRLAMGDVEENYRIPVFEVRVRGRLAWGEALKTSPDIHFVSFREDTAASLV